MESRVFFPVTNMSIYVISISLLMASIGYIWQFRYFPGGKEQIKIQIVKISWLLSIIMIGYSATIIEKIFWHRIYLLSEIFSPYYWFFFISKISRQDISSKYRWFLRIVAFFFSVLVMADSWLHTMEFSVWLQNNDFYVKENWGENLLSVYSYGLCLAAVFFILRWIYTTSGLRRKQALWFGLSGFLMLPVLAIKEIVQSNLFDPLPIGFFVIAVFIAWGFYRWRIYDVVSLAWKTSIHQMYEGVIVVDEYDYIVETNPAGEKLLQAFSLQRGAPYQKLLEVWPNLRDLEKKKIVEEKFTFGNVVLYYEIQWSMLSVNEYLLGKVIIFKDITEKKRIEEQFISQEKAISVLHERNRLGRELHDGPGQVWGYVTMQVEAADTWIEKGQIDKARVILTELLESVQDIHIDMRESITGLKSMQRGTFMDSLQKYVIWFEKTCPIKIFIEQNLLEDIPLSSIENVQLIRILQELLTNIRKHANASVVKIRFYQEKKRFFCEVEDNGIGTDFSSQEKSGHFGLAIIQERINEIGGNIIITPGNSHGTIVRIELHGTSKGANIS